MQRSLQTVTETQTHLSQQCHVKTSGLPVTSSSKRVTLRERMELEKYFKGYQDCELYQTAGNFPRLEQNELHCSVQPVTWKSKLLHTENQDKIR